MKLVRVYINDLVLVETVVSFCRNVIQIGVCSDCFKHFVKLLNSCDKDALHYESLARSILSSLMLLLKEPSYREVFVFSGKANSGIGLLNKKNLPKDGFAFCEHIRLERKNQLEDGKNKMTIFKLASSTNKEIELLIEDGYIKYQVIYVKNSNR